MGGQSTYLPLRVNSGGVIPPIFASSLLAFSATIALIFGARYVFLRTIADRLKWGEPLYTLIYITLILVFAFFLCRHRLQSDRACRQHAQERRLDSGHSSRTHDFRACSRILKRLTFIGAIYLALVCLLPDGSSRVSTSTISDGASAAGLTATSRLVSQRPGSAVLFRRDFAFDRGRRGHGYRSSSWKRNWSSRGLPKALLERAGYVAGGNGEERVDAGFSAPRSAASRGHFSRTTGCRQRHAGAGTGAAVRSAASVDRRHAAREYRVGQCTGRTGQALMARGELVPDSIILKMVAARIERPDCSFGFVFDGFPRPWPKPSGSVNCFGGGPVSSSRWWCTFVIDPALLMRRITGRRMCKAGREIYNIYDRPPKADGRLRCRWRRGVECSPRRSRRNCGSAAHAYAEMTAPLAAYYRRLGRLEDVDAARA